MRKEINKIALAYVGVVVGAGLSSGQDILQYFLSFEAKGFIGIIILVLLNIFFGKIIITLGSYYHSDNHQEVLQNIAHPIIYKIIDWSIILASFIIGFVMIAGAGANLHQQFNLPNYLGALLCTLLIIGVAYLDFDKITRVLGIFTPIIIFLLVGITIYSVIHSPLEINHYNQVSQTLPKTMPNIWISVINYYALCAMTGVSMAFVLGGSVFRIGVAKKAGALGGLLIGLIIMCASIALYLNIDLVKNVDIPILAIVKQIHPLLALIYSFIILGLIFNTAFSLYYGLAVRFTKNQKNTRKAIIIITILGYICSFGGFKSLIKYMYPLIGFIGIILLITLLISWIKEKQAIVKEMHIRRKLLKLIENYQYTRKEKQIFKRLSNASILDNKEIKNEIKQYKNRID